MGKAYAVFNLWKSSSMESKVLPYDPSELAAAPNNLN